MKYLVIVGLFWIVFAPVRVWAQSPVKVGDAAPPFSLLDVHGKLYRLSDVHGQVQVLNFWAFWCDTWKAELPHLKELAGRQRELGFHLTTISVDGTRLAEYEKRTGDAVPFPVLLDVGGQVSHLYGVVHVPTVIIIDAQGRVRFIKSGYPGNHIVLAQVRRLMTEP